jgi:hypothetical protein
MHHVRPRRLLIPVVALALCTLVGVASGEPVELSFVPVTSEVACDAARPIDVWIDGDVTDLRGASLVMRFDPLVIRPVAVEEGQLFLDDPCPSFLRWRNADAIGDSVAVDVAGLGCSVQGPGPIVRLWVTGVADGSTLLRGTDVILRDATNATIPALWTPAHVIVACPVEASDRSWTAIKSAFR